jgi:hypothetical protein
MSASHEWTEWHLTPRGWEPGKSQLDFQSAKGPDAPPADRVLSVTYDEYMGSIFSAVDKTFNENYRSSNASAVDALLEQYGTCPATIHVW